MKFIKLTAFYVLYMSNGDPVAPRSYSEVKKVKHGIFYARTSDKYLNIEWIKSWSLDEGHTETFETPITWVLTDDGGFYWQGTPDQFRDELHTKVQTL